MFPKPNRSFLVPKPNKGINRKTEKKQKITYNLHTNTVISDTPMRCRAIRKGTIWRVRLQFHSC